MYYTLDLKVWQRVVAFGVTSYGVAYSPSNDMYAVSLGTTAPVSVVETTGQGYLSSYTSRNNGAWRKIGQRGRNSTANMRYANGYWFVCDLSYISRISVGTASGGVSTVSSIVFTDAAYHADTGRYLFSGSGTVRHTTDFTTFTSVAVGFGSSPVVTALVAGPSGRIVAAGESVASGRVSTTDDGGTTWTNRAITGTRVRSLAYIQQLGIYVAANQSGEIFTSPDAVTWTKRATVSGGTNVWTLGYSSRLGVAYAIDQYLGITVSQDGVTWSDNGARTVGWEQTAFINVRGAAVS